MSPALKQLVFTCAAIFLLAVGVRFLTWQDNARDIWQVQTSVTDAYKDSARQLVAGEFRVFVSDINHFGHPPGYPILLAAIFKFDRDADFNVQAVQILCDAAAVVLLFLIALELFPIAVAIIAAVLAAISPQFAYFSVLLLPESLVVGPILLAVYFLLRSRRDPRLLNFILAGAFVGLSCWLRANSLLLPLFLAATAAVLAERGKRLRAALAVIVGAVIMIAPITIKNAIVYHSFVPLSLGAGQTLVEGIADYDEAGRFNMPNTDLGLMRQEAEWYGNPEYANLLFGRDGVERDRMRVARGFTVIRSHPFWFASVVLQRGASSIRLEPVAVLAREPPVSHDYTGETVWTNDQQVRIRGDETKYGAQQTSEVIVVAPGNDYVFQLPIKLEEGRMQVRVTNAGGTRVLASAGLDLVEGVSAETQPTRDVSLPFVSANESGVRLVIANYASPHSLTLTGPARLVKLGPSSQQWMRYVRIPLGYVQRLFTTAWMLPLIVIGLVLLVRRREWQTLLLVLTVPAYYLIVQSTLHTERRYVYVIHFFFLLLAATTFHFIYSALFAKIRAIRG